eukprot:COSAG06_NODE_72919_length_164_cov_106707.338462_1_plen_27_part_01
MADRVNVALEEREVHRDLLKQRLQGEQ